MDHLISNLDNATAWTIVYGLVLFPWIVAGAALFTAAFAAGWWCADRQRARTDDADQRTAFDDLARKLAAAEANAARLRDQVMDEQRDRLLADERATAYAHRAQQEKTRADAAAGVSRDLRRALTHAREQVARAVRAGETQPEAEHDPDTCYWCGKPMPLPMQRDHAITEHGVDPILLTSLVRIPRTVVDPR